MTMWKRLFCAVLALALMLCAGAMAEAFEGFDMMIIGDETGGDALIGNETGENIIIGGEESATQEGLTVTVGSAHIVEDSQTKPNFVKLAVDAQVMNWTLGTVNVSQSLTATLTYQDAYTFPAALEYAHESLGVLERMDGMLTFEVPEIVALAEDGTLTLTVDVQGSAEDYPISLEADALKETLSVPFSYETAESDALQLAAGEAKVLPSYHGEHDDVSMWLIEQVKIINWSQEPIALNADAITGRVAFMDTYAFFGQFDFKQAEIQPLEIVTAQLAVRVPTVVTEAGAGEAELWLDTEGFESREGIDMPAAVKAGEALTTQYTPGNTVVFGHYEQDGDASNGAEEIEWRVLSNDGEQVLLISDKGLDTVQYNTESTNVTWETCSLRKWLNNDFLNAAFTAEEQAQLATVTVTADKNPEYSTDPGNDTQDMVYLLSIDEVNQYFSSDDDRICYPTAYAKAQGAWTDDAGACWWWLRSPGNDSLSVACVVSDGSVRCDGSNVSAGDNVVRPVVALRLS